MKLIETMLWDGAGFVRLARHLARLERSARGLGWDCDLARARAALLAQASAQPARMRLTFDCEGRVAVTASALPVSPPLWRLGLAQARLFSGDPWLRVKTTRRPDYDTARQGMAAGLDEVVFLNERGEVCDGTITTVFFDAGDGLCTPPLTCGLLPGVLREEMLERVLCREAVLHGADLAAVRLWVGNSLRGMMPARWADQTEDGAG
ncbi:MAG: aminotransferase class IV family protein [Paracoccaceae bacterium]|nr:aminotransferase class IV family protein [Paracoccaceae bacterium]